MSTRFRKSLKVLPGIYMNISKSGVSWTLASQGASISINKKGTYLNLGVPGTGLSNRRKISNINTVYRNNNLSISIDDNGELHFHDSRGNPIPDEIAKIVKKEEKENIHRLIQAKNNNINNQISALMQLHLGTPSPTCKPSYIPCTFDITKPIIPRIRKTIFPFSSFKSIRTRIDKKNKIANEQYANELANWENQYSSFQVNEQNRKKIIENLIYVDFASMKTFLFESLNNINWPIEVKISSELSIDGNTAFIETNLPWLDMMPKKEANIVANGSKLSVKELSITHTQKIYMNYVHGVTFHIIGESFYSLPNLKRVIFSCFTQRLDKTTGYITNECLLSVNVKREKWEGLNFKKLEALDIIDVIAQFDLRRSMSKGGIFKKVIPFSVDLTQDDKD